jgi:hypothetical protein
MYFQDDDSAASQAFLENGQLSEEKVKHKLDNRNRVWTTKSKAVIYILGAHILGWVLSLQVTLWSSKLGQGSGDEINGIAPPGMFLYFPILSF